MPTSNKADAPPIGKWTMTTANKPVCVKAGYVYMDDFGKYLTERQYHRLIDIEFRGDVSEAAYHGVDVFDAQLWDVNGKRYQLVEVDYGCPGRPAALHPSVQFEVVPVPSRKMSLATPNDFDVKSVALLEKVGQDWKLTYTDFRNGSHPGRITHTARSIASALKPIGTMVR